ncbi:hypothetical protein Y032_0305g1948 [Ancylostoma ceylanicum]|nr:hypothetical protein Y032_0305g1948 [Ancylostoma ceylanicum]
MPTGCFMLPVASPKPPFQFLHEVKATRTSESSTTSMTSTESPPIYQEQPREQERDNNSIFSYSMGILCALVLIFLLIICFATKAERVRRKEKIRYMKRIMEEREMNQPKRIKHYERTSTSGEQKEKRSRYWVSDIDGRRKSKEESAQKDKSDEFALTPNKLRKQGIFPSINKDGFRQNSMECVQEGSPPTTSVQNVPAYVRAHSIAKTRREDTYNASLKSFFLPFEGRAARSHPRTLPLQLTTSSRERISGEMLQRTQPSKNNLKPLQITQMDSQRLATVKTARE